MTYGGIGLGTRREPLTDESEQLREPLERHAAELDSVLSILSTRQVTGHTLDTPQAHKGSSAGLVGRGVDVRALTADELVHADLLADGPACWPAAGRS